MSVKIARVQKFLLIGLLMLALTACGGSSRGKTLPADRLPDGWPAGVPVHDGKVTVSQVVDGEYSIGIELDGDEAAKEARRQLLAAGFAEEPELGRKDSERADGWYAQFRGHGRGIGLLYSGKLDDGKRHLLYVVEKPVE